MADVSQQAAIAANSPVAMDWWEDFWPLRFVLNLLAFDKQAKVK